MNRCLNQPSHASHSTDLRDKKKRLIYKHRKGGEEINIRSRACNTRTSINKLLLAPAIHPSRFLFPVKCYKYPHECKLCFWECCALSAFQMSAREAALIIIIIILIFYTRTQFNQTRLISRQTQVAGFQLSGRNGKRIWRSLGAQSCCHTTDREIGEEEGSEKGVKGWLDEWVEC